MRIFTILFLVLLLFHSCNNGKKESRKKIGEYTVEAHFINDSTIDGIAKYYDVSGTLVGKVIFSDGKRHGPATSYYPNGTIKDSSDFANDLRNGNAYTYDSSGHLISINFFYYGVLMGPKYSYNFQKLTEYSFSDFNKNIIIHTKYDSTGKCIHYDYKAEPFLSERLDEEGNPVLGVFLYFPTPPTFNCTYTLGLTNDKQETKNEVKIGSYRVLVDTILPYPEKGWYYFVSTHHENIKDSINKVYIDVLKERE